MTHTLRKYKTKRTDGSVEERWMYSDEFVKEKKRLRKEEPTAQIFATGERMPKTMERRNT